MNMTAIYHPHTWRCMHAAGLEREYVEQAIRGGLKILGFSDHAPMPYPSGYVSRVRMRLDQLEDYVSTVLRLREEYAGDIEIHLGFEAEYYPAYFEQLLELLSPYPIEYLLLGQHFLGNEIGDHYSGDPTDDPARLRQYCSQCREALETGRFSCFAHPDLIRFTGSAALYEQEMRELCLCAKQQGVPLELNLLGIREGRHYPDPAFWKIAGEVGGPVILGADAHEPAQVCDADSLAIAEGLMQKNGIVPQKTMALRRPLPAEARAGGGSLAEAERPNRL